MCLMIVTDASILSWCGVGALHTVKSHSPLNPLLGKEQKKLDDPRTHDTSVSAVYNPLSFRFFVLVTRSTWRSESCHTDAVPCLLDFSLFCWPCTMFC